MNPQPAARSHTFEGLSEDVVAVCRAHASLVSVKRGHVLIRRGEPARTLYVIRTGYAKVCSISQDGHEIVAAFAGPRDVVGQMAARDSEGSYLVTAVALGPMALASWTREWALDLSARFPAIHERLDAQMVRNTEILLGRLHTVSEGKVPQRLARALVELAERHGRPEGRGISLPLPLTRQSLAGLTGTTLYTVSRIVADWVAAGILESRRAGLRVKRLERLHKLAGS
jgi:CRP-like cAMP-binding protein